MNALPPAKRSIAELPTSPVNGGDFFALLQAAIEVAEPDSAPVLALIEFAGLQDIEVCSRAGVAMAAARRVVETLRGRGVVSVQRSGRLAILIEGGTGIKLDPVATALLGCLVNPITSGSIRLTPHATLAFAQWGRDGQTAEELFVAADQAIHRENLRASAPIAESTMLPSARVNFGPSPLRDAG